MATETIPSSAAAAPKMSRYRSVRRAQEQQHHTSPGAPAVPPMPAVSEMQPQSDAPISRSMSRYHRRPTTSHATSPNPPPGSNTIPNAPPPLPAQLPPSTPSTSRNRAVSSPYQSSHSANTGQRRPRTARTRTTEASPPVSNAPRQQSLRGDDSAREVLQREKERQRQLKEKYEAEARAQKQAKQAELDRIERMRHEEEEAARLDAQREMEEAEALRRQREEQKAEQERGRRLQKAENQKVLQQREEGVRKAKLEEKERQATLAKLEQKARKAPSSSPPVSPPRQQETGFGMFKRRKDEALGLDAPVQQPTAPQLSLNLGEEETIRPGGGGVVLGIDAPTSAVNAGDRVCTSFIKHEHATNSRNSALKSCATRSASCSL